MNSHRNSIPFSPMEVYAEFRRFHKKNSEAIKKQQSNHSDKAELTKRFKKCFQLELTRKYEFDILNTLFDYNNATIAQVVERIIGNDEVTGPTPVSSFF